MGSSITYWALAVSELKEILKQVNIPSIKKLAYINGKTRQAMYEALDNNPYRFNLYLNVYNYYNASRKLKAAKMNLDLCQSRFDKVKKYKKEVESE